MPNGQLRPVATYPAIVGGVLTDIRKRAKMRQEDVAQAVGVAQTTWSRIESGHSSPTVEHLKLASNKLGYSPADILNFADNATANLQAQGVDVKITREEVDLKTVAVIASVALVAMIAVYIAASQK